MKKKFTLFLNKKEAYIIWNILCWFERPLITSVVKHKLADFIDVDSKERYKFDKEVEPLIEDRIMEVGIWLKKHNEQLSKEKEGVQ